MRTWISYSHFTTVASKLANTRSRREQVKYDKEETEAKELERWTYLWSVELAWQSAEAAGVLFLPTYAESRMVMSKVDILQILHQIARDRRTGYVKLRVPFLITEQAPITDLDWIASRMYSSWGLHSGYDVLKLTATRHWVGGRRPYPTQTEEGCFKPSWFAHAKNPLIPFLGTISIYVVDMTPIEIFWVQPLINHEGEVDGWNTEPISAFWPLGVLR